MDKVRSDIRTKAAPRDASELPKQLGLPLAAEPLAVAEDRELVATLLTEALVVLEHDPVAARRCLESARMLVAGFENGERSRNCGLADWQVKKVKNFIRNNIHANLRIDEVAKLVHLSASYFSRSFKSTTGHAYSDFVVSTRIEMAKKLLLTTNKSISEIALACGLADQSHLTRVFSRIVGFPPNTWRRQLRRGERMESPARREEALLVTKHGVVECVGGMDPFEARDVEGVEEV
jgi:AraC-like DNA-binding protein